MSNTLKYAPFWLVWNPNGKSPTYRHHSEASAVAESERLASAYPGETFIVLESICGRRVDNMLCIVMRSGSDVPF